VVIDMNDAERRAMIDQLQEANERERDDMALRAARRAAGQEPQAWRLPESEPPKRSEVQKMRAGDWERWCDDRIARALKAHDRMRLEVHAQVIAEERKRMRTELEAMVAEAVGQLRAELVVERSADRSKVIDLPALPSRKRDAA
jgi:hypothetical protein